MSRTSEQRLEDWFQWYYENAPYMEACDDPRKAAQFYRRACNGLFELQACLLKDIQRLEHAEGRNQLILPVGVRMRR